MENIFSYVRKGIKTKPPMFVQVDKVLFHVSVEGTGPDLFLINGYSDTIDCWEMMMPYLIKYFRVISFDHQGAGLTEDTQKSLNMDTVVQNIAHLIKELKLDRPYVFGRSLGGSIAQHLAIQYPSHIKKLCLCNTVAKWSERVLLAFETLLHLKEKNIPNEQLILQTLIWSRGAELLSDKTYLQKALQPSPHPQSIKDQKRQLHLLKTHDTLETIHSIQTPTLVIHATEDLLAMEKESSLVQQLIPNAHFQTLSGGHGSHEEQPKKLVKYLHKFFK